MKTAINQWQMADFVAIHLPALWVVSATLIGAFALTSLVEEPVSELFTEPDASILPLETHASPVELGTVIGVIDGDTYEVRLDRSGEIARVRLAWVDAPEKQQPFGQEAAQWAEHTLTGKRVILAPQNTDGYGRLVAQLTINDDHDMWDAATTLTRSGLAWLDPRFGKGRQSIQEDQEAAAAEQIGLWSEPSPVPPWDWRGGARPSANTPAPSDHSR